MEYALVKGPGRSTVALTLTPKEAARLAEILADSDKLPTKLERLIANRVRRALDEVRQTR